MRNVWIFTLTAIMLSGCSFLEETDNTLNYATEAVDYVNELTSFAEDTTSLINEAISDPAAKEELENQLTALQDSITNFNEIEVPAIAEELHQTFTENNEKLLNITNNVLENGEVAIEQLQDSEIFQTIENITELKNQIEELGL